VESSYWLRYHLQLFLHLARDVDGFLPDFLNGKDPPFVYSDLRVDHGVAEVRVGIRAQ